MAFVCGFVVVFEGRARMGDRVVVDEDDVALLEPEAHVNGRVLREFVDEGQ